MDSRRHSVVWFSTTIITFGWPAKIPFIFDTNINIIAHVNIIYYIQDDFHPLESRI